MISRVKAIQASCDFTSGHFFLSKRALLFDTFWEYVGYISRLMLAANPIS